MKKTALLGAAALLVVGVGALIYFGNMPQKTFYTDGRLRSVVNRTFFTKTGLYTQYLPDGSIFTVEYKNGEKQGVGKMEKDSRPVLLVHFKDDKMDGPVVFEGIDTGIKVRGTQMNFASDFATGKGQIVCPLDDLLERFASKAAPADRVTKVLGCIAVENIQTTEDVPVSVNFTGSFTYPKFNKTSIFTLTDPNGMISEMMDSMYLDYLPPDLLQDAKRWQTEKWTLTFDKNNKDVTLAAFTANSNKPMTSGTVDFVDIPALLTQAPMAVNSGNADGVFGILKKMAFTDSFINVTGAYNDAEFKGRFTPLLLDFEKGSEYKMNNAKGHAFFSSIVTKDGVNMTMKYPTSEKKLLNMQVRVSGTFLPELRKRLTAATTIEQYEGVFEQVDEMEDLPDLGVNISGAKLFDINGHALLTVDDFTLNVKEKVLKGTVTLFKGQANEQKLQITDPEQPVIVKGKGIADRQIDFDELPSYVMQQLQQPLMDGVIQPAQVEFEQLTKDSVYYGFLIRSFMAGIQIGYSQAMSRHEANKLLDYTARCAVVAMSSTPEVTEGDCRLLLPDEYMPYVVTILPFKDEGHIVLQVSDVPQSECQALESQSSEQGNINGNGCFDAYNDVMVVF